MYPAGSPLIHTRSREKVSVQCPSYATVFEGCIPFHMVAELGRSTSDIRTRANLLGRAASAGSIQLGGSARSTEQTSRDRFTTLGINKALGIGFWTLIFLTCAVGSLFLWEVAAADGSPTQQPNDIQQLGAMLQQMMNEQQRQRDRIEELGQAVQGTAGAIQGTQATTEQVIQQVVAQVQAGFQQEQHQHQEQLAQVSQAVQAIQVQVQQIPVTAGDQLQQIGQAVQAMQGQIQQQVSPEQVQQIGQAVQSLQGQVQQIGSAAAAGGIGMNAPPPAPAGSHMVVLPLIQDLHQCFSLAVVLRPEDLASVVLQWLTPFSKEVWTGDSWENPQHSIQLTARFHFRTGLTR